MEHVVLDLCTYLALSKKTVINLFYFCNQIWKKGYLFELLQFPKGNRVVSGGYD